VIPYRDDTPAQTFPFVTIALILLNCLAFVWELITPLSWKEIAHLYGTIPLNILTLTGQQPVSPLMSLVSSMFLHQGFLHLGGNMLYLWIFGNRIEDSLGPVKYLLFYLTAGIAAAFCHALTVPSSILPSIGASGAISGILGAYVLLYPRAKIHTVVIMGLLWQIVQVPAMVVIGFWAVFQVLSGIASKGILNSGGVAWFAHIGGFAAGMLTIRLWRPRKV
jgi:membrane associated rhomboid family serine protease